jgi:hypothetical protein
MVEEAGSEGSTACLDRGGRRAAGTASPTCLQLEPAAEAYPDLMLVLPHLPHSRNGERGRAIRPSIS